MDKGIRLFDSTIRNIMKVRPKNIDEYSVTMDSAELAGIQLALLTAARKYKQEGLGEHAQQAKELFKEIVNGPFESLVEKGIEERSPEAFAMLSLVRDTFLREIEAI